MPAVRVALPLHHAEVQAPRAVHALPHPHAEQGRDQRLQLPRLVELPDQRGRRELAVADEVGARQVLLAARVGRASIVLGAVFDPGAVGRRPGALRVRVAEAAEELGAGLVAQRGERRRRQEPGQHAQRLAVQLRARRRDGRLRDPRRHGPRELVDPPLPAAPRRAGGRLRHRPLGSSAVAFVIPTPSWPAAISPQRAVGRRRRDGAGHGA